MTALDTIEKRLKAEEALKTEVSDPTLYSIWGKWTGARYAFEENKPLPVPLQLIQEVVISDPVDGIRRFRESDDIDSLLYRDGKTMKKFSLKNTASSIQRNMWFKRLFTSDLQNAKL